MAEFKKQTLKINGVDTVVLSAGEGEPLLFLHGGGTWHGYEFAKKWAEKFRVIHPYHPGFGEFGRRPGDGHVPRLRHALRRAARRARRSTRCIWSAFRSAATSRRSSPRSIRERVKTLTLVAPAGMRSKEHPTLDMLATPGDQIVGMLASNFEVLKPWLPTGPDPEFMGARYRELTTLARLLWEKPWDPKFKRYLHRIKAPTLIIWGDEDRIVPLQHAELWKTGVAERESCRSSRARPSGARREAGSGERRRGLRSLREARLP